VEGGLGYPYHRHHHANEYPGIVESRAAPVLRSARSRDRAPKDDKDGNEDEYEYETSDDNSGANIPISSQNFEISADTPSNMIVVKAKISDEDH
jgi:hypothetical protein